MNFAYDSLTLVLETPAKDKMLKKEELMTKISIPKLLIFKTLQRMRNVYFLTKIFNKLFVFKILDKKKKDQEKIQIEKKQGGQYFQFSLSSIQEEKKENVKEEESLGLLKSPLRSVQKSPGAKKEEEDEEERLKKIEEAERKKYGVPTIFYKIKI